MGDTLTVKEGGGGLYWETVIPYNASFITSRSAPFVSTKLPIFIVFAANFLEVSGHLIRFYLTFLSLF